MTTEQFRGLSLPISTRDRFIFSASELFATKGYVGTTTNDIAVSTGLTEPVLYRHFDGKESLAVAVVEQALQVFEDTLASQLGGKEDKEDRISSVLDTEKKLFSHPVGKVFYMLISGAADNPKLLGSLQIFMDRKRELYRQAIKDNAGSERLYYAVTGLAVVAVVEGDEFFSETIDKLPRDHFLGE